MAADDNTPVVKIVSPAGTKISGSVISLGRFASTKLANTSYPNYKVYFDWDIFTVVYVDSSGENPMYFKNTSSADSTASVAAGSDIEALFS